MSVQTPDECAALLTRVKALQAAERAACIQAAAPPAAFWPLTLLEGGRRITAGRLSEHFRSLLGPLKGFAVVDGEAMLLGEAAERTENLRAAAAHLAQAGLIASGPSELVDLLAQAPADGERPLGRLPRNLARALGARTRVVRLTAFCPQAPETLDAPSAWRAPMLVLALRSAQKRICPGIWDSTAAGMMQAGESAHEALKRESAEEAGLEIDELACVPSAVIEVDCPADRGWMRESAACFAASLPRGAVLAPRDGEVERFSVVSAEQLLELIAAQRLMPQAAIAALTALEERLPAADSA